MVVRAPAEQQWCDGGEKIGLPVKCRLPFAVKSMLPLPAELTSANGPKRTSLCSWAMSAFGRGKADIRLDALSLQVTRSRHWCPL